MAPTRSTTQGQAGKDNSPSNRQSSSTITKLPRLPEAPGSKIQKRALPRRQQPNSSRSQLIYVSASTPFMSAVSRVRKQLDKSLKGNAPSTRGLNLNQRIDLLHRDNGTRGANGEAIVLGTGRAIEKVLSIAAWFTEQSDCEVEVRTKTVGTVDDVVLEEEDEGFGEESRVRKISCLEVTVRLR
ncbi:Rpp20 subunit of nuclear RNase MRP and P-domain-containing protein [Colletotrichum acutatum]|uniref:Rpp20 subunit of nuclear RNase MRP and P-domain-containing protein n=1 Tax=Glomerella acutata TaxID=27357 RepID=A0AAD8UDA4_GLOAC|nr:Rpp20 subunit of nuclear RNase MRP and P-domain-containing protein [Colletotrichum acutatum]KAK1721271.1 Rpp20 subunit of nuclear RNase MRP and P-domain-containing protein [Colletotrichum acutatum]